MSNEPKKPGGPGEGKSWDDDWPTDIKELIKGAKAGDPVQLKELPRSPDDTKQYPTQPKRPATAGAALPSYIVAFIDVLSGPDKVGPHKVTTVRTVLGRGPEADLRVRDERASRKHATITYVDGEFRIRDEESANGTFLNGSKVVEYAIRHGDKVLVGDSLLQFHLGKAET